MGCASLFNCLPVQHVPLPLTWRKPEIAPVDLCDLKQEEADLSNGMDE